MKVRRARAITVMAMSLTAAFPACGDDDDAEPRKAAPARPAGVTEEYLVARAVRGFLFAFTENDGPGACRRLTSDQQTAIMRSTRARSCEDAIFAQLKVLRESEIDALARSKVSKVALTAQTATAEVLTPVKRGIPRASTVELRQVADEWKLSSDFHVGGLAGGTVPKAPPPPPRNPAEEREIAAVFERFRKALEGGDERAACRLRTSAARRAAVAQAINVAGGRRQALREYGGLTCEAVTAGLRIPRSKVRRIVVTRDRGRLSLRNGAQYEFRKVSGSWRVDT